ncbi:hypothetical protein Gohar_019590 [Gossypium harknessii]|uniref:RRM domain-containing protein n=1 Tax=Gossypium harknessii TaxID=34285 RepID=A0A7J9IDS6_9ROSI|nr:hypothetical protein [Gossypium harknessii]
MHWRWLQQLFGYHGRIMDVFIPKKRGAAGRRFGFVSFRAERRFREGKDITRSRKKFKDNDLRDKLGIWEMRGLLLDMKGITMVKIKMMNKVLKGKRVHGAIDDKIHSLQRCLVGWCKHFIKIEDLAMKMSEAGLVGFSIVRISGTIVLMVFESEEKMKEVVLEQGKILDEWFLKKQVWTDSIKMENRSVWLSCYGVPIHVWKILTFQMAGWWGEFISINEETQEPISFMRGNIQLITDCFNGIDEVIDLQVGN